MNIEGIYSTISDKKQHGCILLNGYGRVHIMPTSDPEKMILEYYEQGTVSSYIAPTEKMSKKIERLTTELYEGRPEYLYEFREQPFYSQHHVRLNPMPTV